MNDNPFFSSQDRFPLGSPGHIVPVSYARPSEARPWGMTNALEPVRPDAPTPGNHEKPTKTYQELERTKVTQDGRQVPDDYYKTVTD